MGRKQFTKLPAAPAHYEFYNPASAQVSKDKAFDAAQKAHDQHASSLPMLQPGSLVSLQDPHTGLWNKEGVVTEVRGDKLSYSVQVGNRLFVRSRKMLKLKKQATTNSASNNQSNIRTSQANTCKSSLPNSSHSKQATRGHPNKRLSSTKQQQPSSSSKKAPRGQPRRQQATPRQQTQLPTQPLQPFTQQPPSTWDPGFPQNQRCRQRRPSPKRATRRSNSTGPSSAQGSPPWPSSSYYWYSSTFATARISGQIGGQGRLSCTTSCTPVSYTHLTLPTIYSV